MSSAAIKDNILHPNQFNTSTGNDSFELWNKGNTVVAANNNTVLKTIYSPSPSGYVEPKSAAFTGFESANISSSYNYGINYFCNPDKTGNTIFCYTNGHRDGGSSVISYWHYFCHHWTAGPTSSSNGFSFCCTTSGTLSTTNNDIRYHGFDMRLVLE